jgi:plasmid stabilization system protein ParE
VWRSILGTVDFSVFVYGGTGRFKTALAALLQQHFGSGFAAHLLPDTWASTANFNERLAFIAKDTLLVIDDFGPRPAAAERRRLEGEADRLLRAAANGAGRGRLKSDTSLRLDHPPRALILSTGEERPSGESLIARVFLVEVAPGDIDPARLSARQRDAACGLYAQATAGYIAWLAPRLDEVRAEMSAAHSKYREQAAHEGLHRRTPGIVADLFIGWERFLGFAHETEALTRGEAEGYRARVWSALIEVARRQLEHLQEANPVDRFLALLRSAIAAGRAHVATRDGTAPASPGAWGWRASEPARNRRRVEWLPQGARVGWVDGQDLFLDIDSAYQAANAIPADGDGIAVGIPTLIKRLHEGGRLQSIDQPRGRLKVRRMIDGRRLEVLHLRTSFLEHPIAEKSGPIGPLTGAMRDPPDARDLGGFALVDGVH